MNLDELVLRNVMSGEEAELVHNPSSSSSSSPAAATVSLFLGKRNKDIKPQPDPMAEVSASADGMDWIHYQQALLIDSKSPVSQGVYNHGGIGVYNMEAMSMTTSASSNSDFQEGNCERKRRQVDDMKEKTIERRQRRMIKNRESAARSRARKQAYTNQLEHEVSCLKKTNSWLRKQEASTSTTAYSSTTRQLYFVHILKKYSFLFFFRKQKDYFFQIQSQCRDTNCGAPARPSSRF
ncbi:hypothetical protein IC575_016603 [Cucumis melo]|uniref:BZIP transcription factor ABI5 homolog n=1 Tax=Cucumis melo TaxID=3656 RepID=A0A1S3BAD3_CUCME|nr:bZIP transcription factor ABI5 homolog [Cucumis melo]